MSFSEEERALYEQLETYCKKTGAAKSAAIKRCIRAVLNEDDETIRLMRGFSEAGLRAASRLLALT